MKKIQLDAAKLQLHKEHISKLTKEQSARVVGGTPDTVAPGCDPGGPFYPPTRNPAGCPDTNSCDWSKSGDPCDDTYGIPCQTETRDFLCETQQAGCEPMKDTRSGC